MPKMRKQQLVSSVLGFVLLATVLTYVRGTDLQADQPKTALDNAPPDSPAATEILDKIKISEQALRNLELLVKMDQISLVDPSFGLWDGRLVDAQIAKAPDKAAVIAIRSAQIERLKKRVASARQLLERDAGTRLEVLELQYQLAEAEEALNAAKAQ